jgi:formiminotetrahydrofolate cyclodeaminase
MDLEIRRWLEQLSSNDPTPAGGSLALVTLAGAAALASKCARLSGADHWDFDVFAADLSRYAVEDCGAYDALVSGDEGVALSAVKMSLTHVGRALELVELASGLQGGCSAPLMPDLRAASSLAVNATEVLLDNLEGNLEPGIVDPRVVEPPLAVLPELRARLSKAAAIWSCPS